MVLPLYLAMTAQEMTGPSPPPRYPGVYGPQAPVPPGAMLILDDRNPAPYDPARIAAAVRSLAVESVLLDFEREADGDSLRTAKELFRTLPCPVAAPPGFAADPRCAVFLPPCPLCVPLEDYLRPWQGREIWLDVTLAQQTLTVTPEGVTYSPGAPADKQDGGWLDETLRCRCVMEMEDDQVRFTLFDTPATLKAKLEPAAALGVTRAVGLYQELFFKL